MAVRITLVAICIAAAALLVAWDRGERRCTAAQAQLVGLGLSGRAPAGGPQTAADRLDSSCTDATPLANSAAALAVRPAQAALALRIARRAVAREPDTFAAWVGLGAARAASREPVAAAVAYGRAQRLNPRWPGRLVAAGP